jgi:hypothetical protein
MQQKKQKKVLTFKEGCELLDLEESYMYKLTALNLVPFSKPLNKKIYFDREELEAWALSRKNTVRTPQEIKAEQQLKSEQLDIEAATYISTHK